MNCSCEKPLAPSNPRRKDCNRCGRRIPPPRKSEPIVHHCSRCLEQLAPGTSIGMLYLLYLLDRGIATRSMIRFCEPCTQEVMEFAVQEIKVQHR